MVYRSFCNEAGCEGWRERGGPRFQEVAHRLDGSRPTLANMFTFDDLLSHTVDVQGFSHQSRQKLDACHARLPDKPIYMSECCSCNTFRDEDEGCDTRRGKRVGRECGPRLFTPPPLNQVRDAARQPSHRLHAKELQRALCRVQHCHQRLGRRRVRRRRHGVRSSVLAGVCVRLHSCVCRHNGVDAVRLLRRAASRGLRGLLLVRPVRPLRLPKGGGELGTARPSLTLP